MIKVKPSEGILSANKFIGDLEGSALKLANARNIKLTGSVIGEATFDGSTNIEISTVINHNHDDDYYKISTSRTANTILAAPNGQNGIATFRNLVPEDLPIHNHTSKQIINLEDYNKPDNYENLTTEDTLNQALGKLEAKSDLGITAYSLLEEPNNQNGIIENLREVLDVLQDISDTDKIKDLFLLLSGGTISGKLKITENNSPNECGLEIDGCNLRVTNNGLIITSEEGIKANCI